MQLTEISYSERLPSGGEWSFSGLHLRQRNLVVGKNASGKSRILNVISALSRQLSGLMQVAIAGNFDAIFEDADGRSVRYQLESGDSEVVSETFSVDGTVKLERSKGGEGKIWASEVGGGSFMKFQTPPNQLAALARRDTIQHPFLEPLHEWASSLRIYYFGSAFGKDNLGLFIKGAPMPDDRDFNAVLGLFRQGDKLFGEPFRNAIIEDINSVGYEVQEIGTSQPVTIQITNQGPGELLSLYVRERGLLGITDQLGMSQGMYRALALFIHLNYCQFKKTASCILVDDIGEGLDFERSCAVIQTLRAKTKGGLVQMILSTNDRFVMNNVPLEEWSVLQRVGSVVRVRNYDNSREIFEEFKFTGLSNFNFLEMDVLAGNS